MVSDGCFDEAIGCFDAVLGCVPEHRHTLQWRITALRRLRRFQEADEFATDAIRRLPHCPLLHVEHAWVASDQDQEDEAVTRVERALAIDPRNATALRDRIQFLRWGRQFEQAEQAVTAAIELRPDDPDIHAAAAWVASDQDQEDEAVTRVERALAIDPRNATALRDRIQFLRWGRRFEEAEQAVAAAIELRPDDPDIHTTAAWVASDQDRQDEAVTRVERALAIDPRNATALRSRIEVLRLARQFEQAEQAVTAAIELRPDDPDIHAAAAWVASDQDQEDEAVTRVERALAIDPRNATALRSRIDFLRWARRFEEAEQAAAQAAELRPDDPDIHAAAAWVASDQDQEDEAVTRVERALAIDPRNATALRSRIHFLRWGRRFEEAEQAATAAIELRPDDPDIHAAAAVLWAGLERYDSALSSIEHVLAIDPRNATALRDRIQFLRLARRFEEAEQAAAQAAELRPDDPDIHAAAAWVASDQDQEDEAVTRVERALAIDPRNSWALRSRIHFLRWGRRFEEAEQAATAAIELRPDDPDIHAAAAVLWAGLERYDSALSSIERVLAIDPRNATALRDRIDYLRRAGRYQEAEQAVTAAIELRPDDPDIHAAAAWVASDQDQEDEAVTRVERALAIDPRNATALRSRIEVLRLARRFEQAEQAVTAAIELRPDDPDIHAAAAWVASDQDRQDEAVTRVERALAIDPRNATALRDRIQFLRLARRFEEAEQAVTAAIELRPDDPDIHAAAAWVASDQDRQDEAVARVERALAIDPRNATALRDRIDFLRLARQFEQAEQAATAAIELRPDDPDIHAAAAWVASDQDQEDEAVTRVERALAIDPRNATALRDRIQFLRWGRRFEEAEQAVTAAIELRPDDPTFIQLPRGSPATRTGRTRR